MLIALQVVVFIYPKPSLRPSSMMPKKTASSCSTCSSINCSHQRNAPMPSWVGSMGWCQRANTNWMKNAWKQFNVRSHTHTQTLHIKKCISLSQTDTAPALYPRTRKKTFLHFIQVFLFFSYGLYIIGQSHFIWHTSNYIIESLSNPIQFIISIFNNLNVGASVFFQHGTLDYFKQWQDFCRFTVCRKLFGYIPSIHMFAFRGTVILNISDKHVTNCKCWLLV